MHNDRSVERHYSPEYHELWNLWDLLTAAVVVAAVVVKVREPDVNVAVVDVLIADLILEASY